MDIITKVYNPETPIELMVDLHEYGGCHIDDTGRPGMTDKHILELVPRVTIPSDVDLSNGWWKSDNKETEEEFKQRIRRVAQKLRDLAGSSDEDYTVCIVSHALFMNSFFTSLIASEFLVESKK
jgi:broad specificity phosphatase PhoE